MTTAPDTDVRLTIVRGLATGESSAVIAARLGVSRQAVNVRTYRLAHAYGVHTRTGLVVHAYVRGWLTPTEPEVPVPWPARRLYRALVWIAAGMTDRQVAERLGLALHTVKTYSQDLRAHYGARHRAHTVALAIHHGHLPTARTHKATG
ncbi:LuxR C-terminal-related transcriptional regulator [Streptomyces scopuliridis]|uniref:LuxR C-terminal-related transcriptional regulator n=1 Tax=Streptomyces scopuliridis TaxID=452529 RepID=UPI0036C6D717